MAYETCLTEIQKATGIDDMTPDEAQQMLDSVLATKRRIMAERGLNSDEAAAAAVKELAEREKQMLDSVLAAKRRIMAERGLNSDEAAAAAVKELAEREKQIAAIELRNKLQNMQIRIDRRARLEERAQLLASKKTLIRRNPRKDYLADAIGSENTAINTPVRGGRFSAEAEWHSESVRLIDPINVELVKAGLFKTARDRGLEREWTAELAELSKKDAGEPSDVGKTGSPQALKIAEIIKSATDLAKQKLNDAGAWIGDYAGWIARTVHDPDKIRTAGHSLAERIAGRIDPEKAFQTWYADIRPKLDDRTFEGVKDAKSFLRGIFNEFVAGYHFGTEPVGYKDPAFIGPGNRAKRLSQERILHFKDADAWLDYQHKYGVGNPLENIYHSLDQAGRSVALMNRWGTNPEAEFQQDLRWLKERYTDRDPLAVRGLNRQEKRLNTEMDLLTGKANMPANELGARLNAGIRSWTSMAKLGLVGFTHLTVATTKAAELRYQGVGFLEGYGDFIHSIFEGRGTEEKRELADLLLAGHEGKRADLMSRFSLDDTMPGTMSRLNSLYFKLSGLTYLLDNERRGTQTLMARHLGGMLDRDFDALPAQTKRAFLQYDISRDEWDALRGVSDHFELDDGRKVLTPDAALRSDFEGDKDRLALKLHAYYKDVADRAVITPGIKDRALMFQGNRPGTLVGEALRYAGQFKQWPIAAARMAFGRELYGSESAMQAMGGLAQIIVGSMVTGYAVMMLKDIFKGLNPRPLNDPKTYAAALMQGGGIGIIGDFLFGEYNRFGRNFFETLAGPVPGEVGGTLLDIWNSAKNEARNAYMGKTFKDTIGPELFRTAANNVPFINLFYTRAAMDYFLIWRMQEMMNPGWARRYERRVQQQRGQTFWLHPTEAVR